MTTSISAHQLLEKLALKPIDNTSFPTHFNVVLRLREALNDQRSPFKKIINILNGEPMVSAKIVQSANAATFYGKEAVRDVEKAVYRLGANAVRRIALGVAMAQLTQAKKLLPFSAMGRRIWLHSLYTAATASVLARTFTRYQPDEALFLGLSLNLGAFYLLYQASQYPILHKDQDDVKDAIGRHYLRLTHRVLETIGLPEEMVDALSIAPLQDAPMLSLPQTIQEVLHTANLVACQRYPWTETQDLTGMVAPEVLGMADDFDVRFRQIQSEYS